MKPKNSYIIGLSVYVFCLIWGSETYRAHYTTRPFLLKESVFHFLQICNFALHLWKTNKIKDWNFERLKWKASKHVLLTVPLIKKRAFRLHMGCCLLFQKAQEGPGHWDWHSSLYWFVSFLKDETFFIVSQQSHKFSTWVFSLAYFRAYFFTSC